MNINYHYFAVKVLAIQAGFKEEDAQRIAFYSQAINDFNICTPISIQNVPLYARHLEKKILGKRMFFPVTTGFNDLFDYAQLVMESNQRSITIPFHFIPSNKLTEPVNSRKGYRVIPATMSKPSLMQSMMLDAQEFYLKEPNPTNLIRIGMLLHTFADTYAHQNFSGFWGWENNARLASISDIMSQQTAYELPEEVKIPAIGHAQLNNIPDKSNAIYQWKQMGSGKGNYSIYYKRNNTDEYCQVSLEILNYLLSCQKQSPITKAEWNKLANKMKRCFHTDEKEINKLASHWQKHFPEVPFYYNKDEIFELTDDFFRFNVFADDIRRKVNGITNRDVDFKNYIALITDDHAQLSRLVTFQNNN